jgi:hypothetical protein
MIPRYGEWDRRWRGQGLQVIGVHTPETDRERDPRRVAEFVKQNGIAWPVVLDPDYAVWRRFEVDAWPTIVVMDREGVIRASFVGDDSGPQIEAVLQKLLGEGPRPGG